MQSPHALPLQNILAEKAREKSSAAANANYRTGSGETF